MTMNRIGRSVKQPLSLAGSRKRCERYNNFPAYESYHPCKQDHEDDVIRTFFKRRAIADPAIPLPIIPILVFVETIVFIVVRKYIYCY